MTIVINQRTVHVALVVAAVALLGWLGWKHLGGGRTVIGSDQLTSIDPDNAGINIAVTRPWFTDTVLTFDVRRAGDRDFNRLDVTRCLMQCAQALKDDTTFRRIYLAGDGRRLYYITGDDYRQIGYDYSRDSRWDNTLLATRIPTVTHTLNDSLAFEQNTGLLATVDDADNWNTMMSQLLKHDDPTLLARIFEWVK